MNVVPDDDRANFSPFAVVQITSLNVAWSCFRDMVWSLCEHVMELLSGSFDLHFYLKLPSKLDGSAMVFSYLGKIDG